MEEESFEDLEIARFLNDVRRDQGRPRRTPRRRRRVHDRGSGADRSRRRLADERVARCRSAAVLRRAPIFRRATATAAERAGSSRFCASWLTSIAPSRTGSPKRASITRRDPSGDGGRSTAGPFRESRARRPRWLLPRVYDPEYGGVRGAPKFPASFPVRLLLRHIGEPARRLLAMAEHTLEMMAAGGMHDQLGGGFHRYSTDERWLVPHFEKMLYDNALLALAYAEAWQVTGRGDFARVLRTTLDYVLREMTSPAAAFFSATDADSEGEEGTFFVWGEDEIRALLGADAERFIRFYGVTPARQLRGPERALRPAARRRRVGGARRGARDSTAAREARPHPLRDDKILAAWNGLMISALAFGGRVLGESALRRRRGAGRDVRSRRPVPGRPPAAQLEGRPDLRARLPRRRCVLHRRAARFVRGDVRSTLARPSVDAGRKHATSLCR